MVPCWMFPVALAAGNTFILKPERTRSIGVDFMAELLKQAGLPDGVSTSCKVAKSPSTHCWNTRRASSELVGSTPIATLHLQRGAQLATHQALGGAKNSPGRDAGR